MSAVLSFKSLARPRRAAKALCTHIPAMALAEAQTVIARMCGYEDWAQLKNTSDAPDTQASPDDEDLDAQALDERIHAQVQRVRAHMNNTVRQARELVRLVSPTVRTPPESPAEPRERTEPLRGAAVYMPSLSTRFNPSFSEVFGLFADVAHLRIDFIQPDEQEPVVPHLAKRLTLTFINGKSLTLQGVHFWKFREAIPDELMDEAGNLLHPNPYSDIPTQQMLEYFRLGYDFLFTQTPAERCSFNVPHPLWVEIDLLEAKLTRRNAVSLQPRTRKEFELIAQRVFEEQADKLRDVVSAFVLSALEGPRVELKYVKKGGRGSEAIGRAYVKSTWKGTGHWTVEDLMRERSPELAHPSGCGGNLTYRQLFQQLVQPHVESALELACQRASEVPGLAAEMREQLELPRLKGRMSVKRQAGQLMQGILATSLRLALGRSFAHAMLKAHYDKTFNSWVPGLAADSEKERPILQLEKLINSRRPKD